jgi:hypothetical protein
MHKRAGYSQRCSRGHSRGYLRGYSARLVGAPVAFPLARACTIVRSRAVSAACSDPIPLRHSHLGTPTCAQPRRERRLQRLIGASARGFARASERRSRRPAGGSTPCSKYHWEYPWEYPRSPPAPVVSRWEYPWEYPQRVPQRVPLGVPLRVPQRAPRRQSTPVLPLCGPVLRKRARRL